MKILLLTFVLAVLLFTAVWSVDQFKKRHLTTGLGLDAILFDSLRKYVDDIHARFEFYGDLTGVLGQEKRIVDWVYLQCLNHYEENTDLFEPSNEPLVSEVLQYLEDLNYENEGEISHAVVDCFIQLLVLARNSNTQYSVAGFLNWTSLNYTQLINEKLAENA